MPKSQDYDTATLLAIGIAVVDNHAFADATGNVGGKITPGPNTMSMAHARLHRDPHLRLVQVGWVSHNGVLYTDAQRLDNPHVPTSPVFRKVAQP